MADKQAVRSVQIDNDRVRVSEWQFVPGAATGHHRHAHDYVVVPVMDGELELVEPNGQKTRSPLKKGKAYFRKAGVEHNVFNASSGPMTFVEIELK
ncbi:MAG: cupin domain-containing protein [Acetobacteraceae bacterium]